MSEEVTKKEVKGFGGEFVARFRGHKVAGGVGEPNLGVTVANTACAGVGYGIMRFIKNGPAKNTKFGKFSLIEKIKNGGLK
jgi:hypothetical protein